MNTDTNLRSALPVLTCTDLRRLYPTAGTAIVALAHATCVVERGQQIALMGPSGSGKSTLLHILAGIDHPSSGTISWPALGDANSLRPGPVGVVFQSPSLLAPLNVVENVALPLLLNGSSDNEATQRALEALALLELNLLANKLPEELSGGQAQRVAIARVLASDPQLILADEPTGQLDHESGAHVIDMLIAASDASGAALIINTHDSSVAQRLAIHWTMHNGTLTTDHCSTDHHSTERHCADSSTSC